MKTIHCTECGSQAIEFTATVTWDVLTQSYVIQSIHDDAYCDNCEEDTDIVCQAVYPS